MTCEICNGEGFTTWHTDGPKTRPCPSGCCSRDSMIERPGVYIALDPLKPEATVLIVNVGGKLHSLKVDAEISATGFFPDVTFRRIFTP